MKSENTKKEYKKQKGFSLVEMMITIFVFSLIVGAISGLFIAGIRGQRSTLAHQRLLDQTSYALEYVSRALRMAKKDTADDGINCINEGSNYEVSPDGDSIKFINVLEKDLAGNPYCQRFFLDNGLIKQDKGDGNEPLSLTSDKLKITSLKFYLAGDIQGDYFQPRVTISLAIKGKGQKIEEQPLMIIQTTVSQRNLDTEY